MSNRPSFPILLIGHRRAGRTSENRLTPPVAGVCSAVESGRGCGRSCKSMWRKRMQTRFFGAAPVATLVVIVGMAAGTASASTPIASYQGDFSTTGFANGWRTSPTPAGRARQPRQLRSAHPQRRLIHCGQRRAHGRPKAPDAVAYPPTPPFPPTFPSTFVRPGLGSAEDPSGIERARSSNTPSSPAILPPPAPPARACSRSPPTTSPCRRWPRRTACRRGSTTATTRRR